MTVGLVLVREDGRQTEIPLRRAVHVMGRQTDCQIRIPSGGVSRHHCELTVGDGKISIRDLGSSNGTYVNRKRITQQDLTPGDLVCIGDLVFVLRVDGEPANIDAEDSYDDGIVVTAAGGGAPAAPKASAPQKRAEPKPDASDESSVADFDFFDEDDDIKKQPKL